MCKESTVDCVGLVVIAIRRVITALTSIFEPSGKERGPGAGFGDL